LTANSAHEISEYAESRSLCYPYKCWWGCIPHPLLTRVPAPKRMQ